MKHTRRNAVLKRMCMAAGVALFALVGVSAGADSPDGGNNPCIRIVTKECRWLDYGSVENASLSFSDLIVCPCTQITASSGYIIRPGSYTNVTTTSGCNQPDDVVPESGVLTPEVSCKLSLPGGANPETCEYTFSAPSSCGVYTGVVSFTIRNLTAAPSPCAGIPPDRVLQATGTFTVVNLESVTNSTNRICQGSCPGITIGAGTCPTGVAFVCEVEWQRRFNPPEGEWETVVGTGLQVVLPASDPVGSYQYRVRIKDNPCSEWIESDVLWIVAIKEILAKETCQSLSDYVNPSPQDLCHDNTLQLKAIIEPEGAVFPDGKPIWTWSPVEAGIVSPTVGETVTFTPTSGYTSGVPVTITAQCCETKDFVATVVHIGPIDVLPLTNDDLVPPVPRGGKAKVKATTIPNNRPLRWEVVKRQSPDGTSLPLLASVTGEGPDALLEVDPECPIQSVLTIRATDMVLDCCYYEVDVEVDCGACKACNPLGACSFGSGSGVNVKFSLGSTDRGVPAGNLWLKDTAPTPLLYSPQALGLTGPPVGVQTLFASNVLRQVIAPQGIVDVTVGNQWTYAMKFYKIAQVGPVTNGLFPVAGEPLVSYVIRNPDPPNCNSLHVIKTEQGQIVTNAYVWTVNTNGVRHFALATGNGLRREVWAEGRSGPDRVVTNTVINPGGATIGRTIATYRTFDWGEGLVRAVTDLGGAFETNTVEYYDNPAEAWRYGRAFREIEADGSWTRYDYNAQGRRSAVVRSWKDTPPDTDPDAAHAFYYGYQPVDAGDTGSEHIGMPRTVTEKILGVTVSKTYYAYVRSPNGELVIVVEHCATGNTAYGAAGNLRTTTVYYPVDENSAQGNRTKMVQHPDGRIDSHTYDYGSYVIGPNPASNAFTVAVGGKHLRHSVIHGSTTSPVGTPFKTTMDVAIEDPFGRGVQEETWSRTDAGYTRIGWAVHGLDDLGRETHVYRANGSLSESLWACCGKEWEKTEEGAETSYLYDALKRVTQQVRHGFAATNGFPAQADIFAEYIYDAAGRRISQTTFAGGLSQTTSNSYDLAGRLLASTDHAGLVTTYAYPDPLTSVTISPGGLLTNTTVRYPDGRAHYSEQNGIRRQTHMYGVNPDGTQWTTVYEGPAGAASPAWSRTVSDLLGRTLTTPRPAFGGTTLVTSNTYDTAGHLIRTQSSSAGGVYAATLYAYDSLGDQTLAAQDLDLDGQIDLAGPDRVQGSDTWYEADASNHYWRVSASIIYPHDASAIPLTNSISRTRLTGLGLDSEFGILTSESCSLDLLGNPTISRTYVDRDARTVTQVTDTPDSVLDAIQLSVNGLAQRSISPTGVTNSMAHDALGRQISATDGRGNTSRTHYDPVGRVDWTADAAGSTNRFLYDALTGRRVTTTDPLGQPTHTAYDSEGRVIATWGATYPVAYEYDSFGRMAAMATTRDPAHESVNLLTLLPAGVMLSDVSDPSYPSDKLDTTRWLYHEPTGLLTNKLYADNHGPSYTYTPDGKLATRTWARGVTTAYAYDACCGALTNIVYSDSTPAVSFQYDRLGRQKTITDVLGTRAFTYNDALQLAAETNALAVLARSHDALGRPHGYQVTAGEAAAQEVAYAYSDRGRFASLSSVVPSTSNMWNYTRLANSDLISGWSNGIIGTVKCFESNRDLVTQVRHAAGGTMISQFDYENDELGRRTRRLDSGSTVATNLFAYDARSQLTNAVMKDNVFAWVLDPIGNRVSDTSNSVTHVYQANALNQYEQITNGGIRNLAYDWDGNLTNDSVFVYVWDGEHRLVGVNGSGIEVAHKYDYMSRRVEKTANGVTNSFLYDGWNLVAETSSVGVTNFYVWGPDLSGTLQGAGGIGGLLAVIRNGQTYYPGADANGNITDYVNTNGAIVAHREFDAYGNTMVATGPMVNDFSFWFSSKYLDRETGLYYYGYRFYNPDVGRWINRDPSGELFAVSIMAFVGNAPSDVVDVLGLFDSWYEFPLWFGPFQFRSPSNMAGYEKWIKKRLARHGFTGIDQEIITHWFWGDGTDMHLTPARLNSRNLVQEVQGLMITQIGDECNRCERGEKGFGIKFPYGRQMDDEHPTLGSMMFDVFANCTCGCTSANKWFVIVEGEIAPRDERFDFFPLLSRGRRPEGNVYNSVAAVLSALTPAHTFTIRWVGRDIPFKVTVPCAPSGFR